MRRKVALVLAGLALTGTAAVAAFLAGSGPERVPLSDQAGAADRVTLYQNGLAFVELQRNFSAGQGQVILDLAVPSSTILDSLRLSGEGVDVKEVRASPGLSGPVQLGDEVVVRTAGGSYEGVLVERRGDGLVLSDGANATVVRSDAIEAIEVQGRDLSEADPTAARVSILVDAEAGNRSVTVTYLAAGPSWHPSYELELSTGEATFFATLTGLHTWRNVTLDLVAGSPNLVATPSQERTFQADAGDGGAQGAGGPSYDVDVSGPAALGELHRYTLGRTTNLTSGETVRLPVSTGEWEIVRRYRAVDASVGFGSERGDSRSVDVLERYEIRNTFQAPLPTGVVRFYRDATWVGEDVLRNVPAGETGNVTVARSLDVTAQLRLSQMESTASKDTRTYTLTVENDKTSGEPIDLEAALSYPSYRTNLVSTDPEPDRVSGTTVRWLADLPAGDAATFRLTYEELKR